MTCKNCLNPTAIAIRCYYYDGRIVDACDQCGGISSVANVPDVYFKEPYWDQHLSCEEFPGPKYIGTRAEKAFWLKKCNLREAGDRVRGAIGFDPSYSRTAHENFRRQTHHG